MTFFQTCLYFFLASFCSFSLASVDETFDSIKSNPNALYAFLKEMPKGGELHYHLAGGTYPEFMLTIAAQKNNCMDTQTLTINPASKDCHGIQASDLGNHPDVYEQVLRNWSMKDFTAINQSGHDHFFASFFKFIGLIEDNFIPFLAEIMQRAANQNELYMEIMIQPNITPLPKETTDSIIHDYAASKKHLLANPVFIKNAKDTNKTLTANMQRVRQYLGCNKAPQQEVCQLNIKFQYYVLREQPLDAFFSQALQAFITASLSPSILAVNLVQAEDGFIALRDYQKHMQIFNFLHSAYPNVHIALHAGELEPAAVTPTNLRFHIHDAIAIGHAERIGHGAAIAYEDNAEALLALMASQPIPVEINLTSNKTILNLAGHEHPLNYYLAHHVPIVLSTDDEGILRTDLTRQYVEAVIHHGIDYPTLKQINRNALSYSFLPGKNLWSSINKAEPVSACLDLMSQKCIDFTHNSEKANLQKILEIKLHAFEERYRD